MSTQRMLKDEMWSDDWFYDLDPSEKLMWVFLLTNPRNNIAGLYKANLRWIGSHTGFDKEVVKMILDRFKEENKVTLYKDWIFLNNHHKHQSKSPKIEKGVYRIISESPPEVLENIPFDTLCLRYRTLLNLTLPNLTQLNSTEPNPTEDPIEEISVVEEVKKKDPIIEIIDEFRLWNPAAKMWYGNKTERAACENLIEAFGLTETLNMIRSLPDINQIPYVTAITTPWELFKNHSKVKAQLQKQKLSEKPKQKNYEII